MTTVTVALAWRAGVGLGLFPLWALLRATVQLTVIALLLRGILSVPWTVIEFVAGILVGSAMNAGTLAGRNFLRGARAHTAEIEAWFALGASRAQAHTAVAREAVRESALPTLDQSKSTGLVTLPGAFVGALFGGASPATAAQFQLVVLAGIAVTTVVTGVVVTRVTSRTPYLTP